MRVPVWHILAAGLATLQVTGMARADSKGIVFTGTVSRDTGLTPERAQITSYADRAAFELVVANPDGAAAVLSFASAGAVTVVPSRLTLPAKGRAIVRLFFAKAGSDRRTMTVCAIRASQRTGAALGRSCGRYSAKFKLLD